MNLMYFYESFNSLTVKEPLLLAFNEEINHFIETGQQVDGYKAIQLAFTLDSKRINEPSALERLIEEKEFFKIPSLYLLLDFSLELLGQEKYKSLKEQIKRDYFKRISEPIKALVQTPARRLRFTELDTLAEKKRVRLVVEGKTDAEIVEHAFYCLTNGTLPYWSIRSAGNLSGGATEVAKSLIGANPLMYKNSIVIGILNTVFCASELFVLNL